MFPPVSVGLQETSWLFNVFTDENIRHVDRPSLWWEILDLSWFNLSWGCRLSLYESSTVWWLWSRDDRHDDGETVVRLVCFVFLSTYSSWTEIMIQSSVLFCWFIHETWFKEVLQWKPGSDLHAAAAGRRSCLTHVAMWRVAAANRRLPRPHMIRWGNKKMESIWFHLQIFLVFGKNQLNSNSLTVSVRIKSPRRENLSQTVQNLDQWLYMETIGDCI